MDQKDQTRLSVWGVRLAALAAILNGGFWLIGYATGVVPAWSASGVITVKTNMALGQLLAGLALLASGTTTTSKARKSLASVAATLVVLFGALTLVEHLLHVDLGIDQLLAREAPGAIATTSPNRMGLPGSLSLTLIGAGLLALCLQRRWTPYLGIAVCLINLVPLLGFLYRIEEFYLMARVTGIAWQTAVVLMILGLGLVLAEERTGPLRMLNRKDAGGRLFRHWLPAVLLVPVFFGWLRVLGERRRLFDTELGTGILVLSLILIFVLLLWASAEHLSLAEQSRRAAELSKQRLAQQKQLALDAARLGWWQYDPVADTATGDERFREILGFSNPQLAYGQLLERVHPDDLAQVKTAGQAALKAPESIPFSVEHRIVRPNGDIRWVEVHAIASLESVSDVGSRRAFLTGTIQDITDRKVIEEVLKSNEQKYRLLFDRNPDGVFVVDTNGRFTVVNPASEILSGYTASELLQKNFLEICASDRLEATSKQFKRNLEDRSYAQLETAMIRKDGKRVELWIAGEPIVQHGTVIAVHCTARDITERKRVESVLRESEEQFRTLADSIPNLAWWANGDGNITWYNRRWYDYTGTTPQQMRDWGWQSVHDPAVLPSVLERWNASIASGQAFEMEFPLRGGDGKYRWFLTRITPLRDSAGRVLRWFGTNTDVSETRAAREVLMRSKLELEQLVSERTAKLQDLVGELEHFSYTITHDMRAPLRAMKGFAEVIDELSTGAQPELRQFVGRIIIAADRMDLLIRDALNYSKAVRQELPLEPVDVAALLRGMLDSYPELQPSKARIQIQGELPTVMANEAGLTQCFSNLLGNAVKFVRSGTTPEIQISAEYRDGWVRLSVKDNGIGISKQMLPRVFDMFSRGQNNYEGTGIGLALVRKAVQRMGGKLGVESEEGQGSCFWLELQSWEPPTPR